MRLSYPEYSKEGITTEKLYNKLDKQDKKLLDDFLRYCSISAGPNKIKDIKTSMVQFRDVTQVPYKKVDLRVLRDYLAVLEQSNRAIWTKNGIKAYLKRFYRWLFKDWSDRFDNFHDVKTPAAFNEKKINDGTLITPQELELLCRVAESYRDKAVIMLTYESGARPQEIRTLRWKDITFNDDGTAKVSLYSGKTSSARTILIKDSVLTLKDYEQHYAFQDRTNQDLVFPGRVRGVPMVSANFSLIFNRLGKKANINRPVFPYLFRHSRLTELHKILPEQIHKKYAGHSKDSRMTAVYSHINSDDVVDSLLSKVYKVENLTPEQKNKYDKEIEELKKRLNTIGKDATEALKAMSSLLKAQNDYDIVFQRKSDKKIFPTVKV